MCQVGTEDFERHESIILKVVGQENRGHTAVSELTLDPVAVGQGGLKMIQHIRQASSCERLPPNVTLARGGQIGARLEVVGPKDPAAS